MAKRKNNNLIFIGLGAVALIGGGAFVYAKNKKSNTESAKQETNKYGINTSVPINITRSTLASQLGNMRVTVYSNANDFGNNMNGKVNTIPTIKFFDILDNKDLDYRKIQDSSVDNTNYKAILWIVQNIATGVKEWWLFNESPTEIEFKLQKESLKLKYESYKKLPQ